MRPLSHISAHPAHASLAHREDGTTGSARMTAPPHFGTTFTRFLALDGDPPKAILTTTLLTPAYGWVLRQAVSSRREH
eukprot:8220444-Pyramimonas_sp.AAC.1